MMKNLLIVAVLATIGASNICYSEPLAENSPELKQLMAMGYDIVKPEKDDFATTVSIGSAKILVSKNGDETSVFRSFSRRKGLSKNQEHELLKTANQVNVDTVYQLSLGDTYLAVSIYLFGPHETKSFAKALRLLEQAATIYQTYPKLLELTKN